MIANERQYKISRSQADKFKAAIESFDVNAIVSSGVNELIARAQLEQIKSEYEILLEELEEYDRLVSGEQSVFEASSLEELPIVLIKARIARNWTQKELAEKLNLKEQQIQRYESDLYRSANLKLLTRVADSLDLNISERATLPTEDESFFDKIVKDIPINEMYKRGWFEDFSGTLKDAKKNASSLLENFYITSGVSQKQIALHKKKLRTDSKLNQNALSAWEARIVSLCRDQILFQEFDVHRLTPAWFKELSKLSQYDEGPLLAKEWLLESGIYFCIEPHLPQTYLDGAAIMHPNGTPIVAITLRFDRLDNFWFVLFHELAHIALHFESEEYSEFFDDIEIESNGIEKEADEFALNSLIPKDKWVGCLSRFSLDEEIVREEAKQLQIHPAILAGRIRHERNNFMLLTDIVGYDEVSRCLRKDSSNYELFF